MRTSFLPVPCGASVSAGAVTDKLTPSGCRGENRNAFKIKLPPEIGFLPMLSQGQILVV